MILIRLNYIIFDDNKKKSCKESKDAFDLQLNTNEMNNTIEMNAKVTDVESAEQRCETGIYCSMKSNQHAHHLFTQNGCLLK